MEDTLIKLGIGIAGFVLLVVWMTFCKPDWWGGDEDV